MSPCHSITMGCNFGARLVAGFLTPCLKRGAMGGDVVEITVILQLASARQFA